MWCVCAYVYHSMYVCAAACIRRSEDSLVEEVLFFLLYVDSEDQTQLIYPLSHLLDHELSLSFFFN